MTERIPIRDDLSGTILVTGAAGFIGYHLCQRLLGQGCKVIGVDNLNDYYDPALKHARLARLEQQPGFRFDRMGLEDRKSLLSLFAEQRPRIVVNLAAQAGVRYSLENPHAYIDSNLVGFMNILEGCRHFGCEHLVYASSSSVYGSNKTLPFSTSDRVDHPISLYAASKKANELMAHTYSHLFGLPTTGLRFFTVYGPWGRPDMALFLFTKAILSGHPIQVYNEGKMERDFTFVDDIVEGITRVMQRPPQLGDAGLTSATAPYRVYNIGNHTPVPLLRFIELIEECTGSEAKKEFLPMQPGDVPATCADVGDLMLDVGFSPRTPVEVGIPQFVSWYREYYKQ